MGQKEEEGCYLEEMSTINNVVQERVSDIESIAHSDMGHAFTAA